MLTLAITANSPFAPTRLFSILSSLLFFPLTLLVEEAWKGCDDEGEGCLKEKKIKVVAYCKPQVFDFNSRGRPLRGIFSA